MTIMRDFDDAELGRANATFRSVVTDIVKEPLDETLRAVQGESQSVQKLLTEQRRFLHLALEDATLPEVKAQVEQLLIAVDDMEARHVNELQQVSVHLTTLVTDIESRAAALAASRHLEVVGRADDHRTTVDLLSSRLDATQRQIDVTRRLVIAVLIMCLFVSGGVAATLLI